MPLRVGWVDRHEALVPEGKDVGYALYFVVAIDEDTLATTKRESAWIPSTVLAMIPLTR